MIDISNIVINTVANAVWNTTGYSGVDVTSDYNPTPETFPCVFIYEASNTAYENSFDDALTNHHVNVMYVIDVFALDLPTATALRDICDTAMQNMKFTRNFSQPTFNVDRTIKRFTSRYTAVVGEPITSGNKTIYQMYRS